jgi:RNase H-fold protein (predicted Holliday junction resolvase)
METIEYEEDTVVVVVGVDFGTSRSGFAFSWLNDTSDTVLKINKFSF